MTTRIHFIHAPDPQCSAHQNFGNRYLPTWAFELAAYIPHDGRYEVDLFDTRVCSVSDVSRADLYLFSALNQDFDYVQATQRDLRERYPDATFVLGGPICWSFEKGGELERLGFFDAVCIGDGELLMSEILERFHNDDLKGHVLRRTTRFDLNEARPMDRALLEKHARNYYGGVVEVSRGCPFLCEFCDIRVLNDNNRAHNKNPDVVVQELDNLSRLGISAFMFACDNFIGEPRWAHEVVDAILDWRKRSGFKPSLFTWLTINLYRDTTLMTKMRRAGFDVLFIGVESFDQNSLLEMAKVQNRAMESLPEALRTIQSFGFVVTPGIIFGFDSDSEHLYDITMRGLTDAALLVCNAGLLIALPGTPLYRRMQLAGRLRATKTHIGRFTIESNILYLLPKDTLVQGYLEFVAQVSNGKHQYARFKAFMDNLDTGNYIPLEGEGYGNLADYLRNLANNRQALRSFAKRILAFARHPTNAYYAAKGLALVVRRRHQVPDGHKYFVTWVYGWTNFVSQNSGLSAADFNIESYDRPLAAEAILPRGYDEIVPEDIPVAKTRAQRRATVQQLHQLVSRRAAPLPQAQ